jgi:hypothetical protein
MPVHLRTDENIRALPGPREECRGAFRQEKRAVSKDEETGFEPRSINVIAAERSLRHILSPYVSYRDEMPTHLFRSEAQQLLRFRVSAVRRCL